MITESASPSAGYLDGIGQVLRDDTLDPAFRALVMALPGEDDIAQTLFDGGLTPDPDAIYGTRRALSLAMALHLSDALAAVYDAMAVPGPYAPDAEDAGKRSLRAAALGLLTRIDGGDRARAQFAGADNMTEQLGALGALLTIGAGDDQLDAFADQWGRDRLVMDKWFMLQTLHAAPERAADIARTLSARDDFDWKNPNRFRALIGGLAANHAGLHYPSGEAYELIADWLIRLDPVNPQTAARMTTIFETWRSYDADRAQMMRAALERIAASPNLSRDSTEMTGRILG